MQSDESEKRRMDSTQKDLFKSLTERSEETLGAGEISEEDTSDKFVQEENDFCESFMDPSSGTSRSGYIPDSMFQDEDDKRWKDAAEHQAKMSELSARLTKRKTSSAGASSMPIGLTPRPIASSRPVGLTPRPDPNRTQQPLLKQALSSWVNNLHCFRILFHHCSQYCLLNNNNKLRQDIHWKCHQWRTIRVSKS